MSFRVPNFNRVRIAADNPDASLAYEIAQEKASALGRLGRALEAALAALRSFDVQNSGGTPASAPARSALVAEAGYALWQFIVQREACGLNDSRQVLRAYGVPGEVAARTGLLPGAPAGRRARQP